MVDSLALLSLLIGLELVLGVDNILVISIFVGRLPVQQRNTARIIGLGFALLVEMLQLRYERNKKRNLAMTKPGPD